MNFLFKSDYLNKKNEYKTHKHIPNSKLNTIFKTKCTFKTALTLTLRWIMAESMIFCTHGEHGDKTDVL